MRSGAGPRRWRWLRSIARRTKPAQAAGISDSTARRDRTSSDRLVSWVDDASIECGRVATLARQAAWNTLTGVPNTAGSPPTSFSATKRL